ncbi:hypothetical protein MRX96_008015 [Rhipicephalus microplus]
MCSPAVVQRQIDTGNKEDDERHPSVEHPFNAILSCSSHNYYGVPWHDSKNCCGSGKQILGKHQEKRSTISPTAAEHGAFFSEDDGERYQGTERPFKTASTSSGHDYESVTWYDSVNSYSCRVGKGYSSANCAPRAPQQSPTTFATINVEQCLTTLGGLFAPQLRADHPFGSSVFFPFLGLASRLPAWFLFGNARGNSFGVVGLPRRGCQRAHDNASIQRGSESSITRLKIAELRSHCEPKCSSFS